MEQRNRRGFIRAGLAVAGTCFPSGCGNLPFSFGFQPKSRMRRIGFVNASRAVTDTPPQAFLAGLQEYGWIDGQNVEIDWRFYADDISRVRPAVEEVLQQEVEIVVAAGVGVRIAHAASQSTPIVGIGIPVGTDAAPALVSGAGNVTGLSSQSAESAAKRLELLRELLPFAHRVAVFWNGDEQSLGSPTLQWRATQAAADALGMQLVSIPISGAADIEQAFSLAHSSAAEAVLVFR
jgi:putative tryptophan/tyrosine transport system substrate-binding protein